MYELLVVVEYLRGGVIPQVICPNMENDNADDTPHLLDAVT
jgi:hypothetical protein